MRKPGYSQTVVFTVTVTMHQEGRSFIKAPRLQLSSSPVIGYSRGKRREAVSHKESSEVSKCPITNRLDRMEAMLVTITNQLSRFTKTLVTHIVRLREELHALRLEVNALRYQHAAESSSKLPNLPVHFPMHTVEDIQLLNMKLEEKDTYLLLVDYLSKLGGKSVSDCIGNLMRSTMTEDLTASVNWRGINNGFSLASTLFVSAVVETVTKHQCVGVSQAAVKEEIQRWIQNSRNKVTKERRLMVDQADVRMTNVDSQADVRKS
ncbi:hypothetical protein P879_01879 [Paragonimus westermani]|uniref:DUF4806 domain-containing protein n=1 Tax=Paragonimus westermani TaxID=34504 RepID=A0A8T0DJA5_9TREM|nr:hypothetical protein P879_01879 [Paragonimus westermani]